MHIVYEVNLVFYFLYIYQSSDVRDCLNNHFYSQDHRFIIPGSTAYTKMSVVDEVMCFQARPLKSRFFVGLSVRSDTTQVLFYFLFFHILVKIKKATNDESAISHPLYPLLVERSHISQYEVTLLGLPRV